VDSSGSDPALDWFQSSLDNIYVDEETLRPKNGSEPGEDYSVFRPAYYWSALLRRP